MITSEQCEVIANSLSVLEELYIPVCSRIHDFSQDRSLMIPMQGSVQDAYMISNRCGLTMAAEVKTCIRRSHQARMAADSCTGYTATALGIQTDI